MTVEAVLDSHKGLVVAPAGCGKTHLITETLNVKPDKCYLVLTHTTAGVAALKLRLKRLGISNSNYVVTTIDGWARQVASSFPVSCNILNTLENPRGYYPELRQKVNGYISSGNLTEVITSSYSRLLVDEYQDCNMDQHSLICSLSDILPTIVFGDPMQCIFDFAGTIPLWDEDVKAKFPLIRELDTPWRWINTGTPNLGQWVLECREQLLQGRSIDLSSCPSHVSWTRIENNWQVDRQNQTKAQYQIRSDYPQESLLVIGDSINSRSRHDFASTSRGIGVVEPVDLGDILNIASQLDYLSGQVLAELIITAASTMMTGVGRSNLEKRMPAILAGRNRKPATEVELAVKEVINLGSKDSMLNLLTAFELSLNTRTFRYGAFSVLKNAILLSVSDPNKTIKQAAEIVREQRRQQGDRRIPRQAIGSTLLLKGLEADHSLILNASSMNAHNLYVALSRGAKSITIFSDNKVVL